MIALWEQLEESGEEELLQQAVSRLELYPLKITQVCHVEHLAKLVDIHVHKRLSDRYFKFVHAHRYTNTPQ